MMNEFAEIGWGIEQGLYQLLGYGSGRRVYDLNNGYVVKAAVNIKGIAQNRVESMISEEYETTMIAKAVNISDDFRYLIMEKAEKLNRFTYVLQYYGVRNLNEILTGNEIMTLIHRYHMIPNDLRRISSWGIIDGKPVIIDYGFTKEVKNRYYIRKGFFVR